MLKLCLFLEKGLDLNFMVREKVSRLRLIQEI